MPDINFKDDHTASLADGRRWQKKIQDVSADDKYIVGLFGSSLMAGRGHDVDLALIATPDAELDVETKVREILDEFCNRLILYLVDEYENTVDVFVNFITDDGIYIDLYAKGPK